ncbi:MAG: pyruvate:ferredoxin (flavodoxin) oxidoreductase, partial [Anaerolineae bacterium]|nr:pyruvate:ferredoxin (flavodoxin) oxidoreductase [Anaerolineae bacterium]
MEDQLPLREEGRKHWAFFESLPETPHNNGLKFNNVKNVQLLEPLFEFSGACAGCGETPYLKLVSQLFGDRSIVANATGCSSIYGGNLPTTPWSTNEVGRGPAWSNSLFEDNAEFGLGMRITLDKQVEYARELVTRMRDLIGNDLATDLLNADQRDEAGIDAQRNRVVALKDALADVDDPAARDLLSLAD